jgi:hypothetical protein
MFWPGWHGASSAPWHLDPFLNIASSLAGSELDDPEVRQTVQVKRIFLDDGFDFAVDFCRRRG